ncbi:MULTISPECIES: hypothetical protein [Clostridia]|jgi:hypothetical protein|uniref:hypothetical protein n=1 Tax=Clostridia TaxID=186801 RepID=UPI00131BC233|nr:MULTISPECIES: hypothetical protein [Clostridia]
MNTVRNDLCQKTIDMFHPTDTIKNSNRKSIAGSGQVTARLLIPKHDGMAVG